MSALAIAVWIGVTIAVYAAAVTAQRALRGAPLANPTLATILVVAVALHLTGTHPAHYARATLPLAFLLGPATVALGVPLAANLAAIRRDLVAILSAVVAGAVAAAASGALILQWLGGGQALARAMLPKAATTPIAMAVASTLHASAPLAATFAIAGGLVVAVVLAPVMRLVGGTAPQIAGLAAGAAGSGIGAATAARLGEREAAFAAMGVGLMGLVTALIARPVAALLGLG